MKIYIQDHCWAGCIVVIANSEPEAREMMKDLYNYDEKEPVEEKEIELGLVHYNFGDL